MNNITVRGNLYLLPRGVIVAWNGGNPPASWATCNGANGTPDLSGRFILGAGQGNGLTNKPFSQTGGEENHKLTTNELPAYKSLCTL